MRVTEKSIESGLAMILDSMEVGSSRHIGEQFITRSSEIFWTDGDTNFSFDSAINHLAQMGSVRRVFGAV
jgi:hypothetical protein